MSETATTMIIAGAGGIALGVLTIAIVFIAWAIYREIRSYIRGRRFFKECREEHNRLYPHAHYSQGTIRL